ncbi:MAG: hypothetical protein OEM81_14710 [Acidimicrobiia bacterium]|nr:hypothetical protein [Acidimicrobiia bacterium]MDH3399060.1 hypothetical protein [Acidimicrobiia bacterium]
MGSVIAREGVAWIRDHGFVERAMYADPLEIADQVRESRENRGAFFVIDCSFSETSVGDPGGRPDEKRRTKNPILSSFRG